MKVTNIARGMVMRYGMVESLGDVAYEEEPSAFLGNQLVQRSRSYSEATAREIDVAVREIVSRAREKAVSVLRRERSTLERGAALLLEKETLSEADLAALSPGRAGTPAASGAREM